MYVIKSLHCKHIIHFLLPLNCEKVILNDTISGFYSSLSNSYNSLNFVLGIYIVHYININQLTDLQWLDLIIKDLHLVFSVKYNINFQVLKFDMFRCFVLTNTICYLCKFVGYFSILLSTFLKDLSEICSILHEVILINTECILD